MSLLKFLSLSLGSVLIVGLGLAALPANAAPSTAYLPLTDGTRWRALENGAQSTRTVVYGSEFVNGISTKGVLSSNGIKQFINNDANGIRLHGKYFPAVNLTQNGWNCGFASGTQIYNPPMQLLSANPVVSELVTGSGTVSFQYPNCGSSSANYAVSSTVLAVENVTVPAGTYSALKVQLNISFSMPGNAPYYTETSTYWLAENVGLVKVVTVSGATTQIWELQGKDSIPLPPIVSAPFLPLADGTTWSLAKNGVPGYTRAVSGSKFFNGVTAKVFTFQPEGGENYTNDVNGIRLHGAFAPNLTIAGCPGPTNETDTMLPPLSMAASTASWGQSIAGTGADPITLSGCTTLPAIYTTTVSFAGFEMVTTPAGTFDALKMVMNRNFLLSTTLISYQTSTFWAASGIGTVRSEDISNGVASTFTLLSTSLPITDTIPPSAPPGLTATAVSAGQINLAWTAAIDDRGVTGYRVERCQGANCSAFAQIATPTVTNFSDTGRSLGTSYSYRVLAIDAAGNLSPYSDIISATTLDTIPPTAPANLTATVIGAGQISLAWTAATDNWGVTGYRVERCQGGACTSFVQIGTTSGNVVYSDTAGLVANTSYSYRVCAVDAAGNLGPYSNIAQVIKSRNDFSGDGKSDILWRNAVTGDDYLWMMNGLNIANQGYLPTIADTTWQIAAVGDFDADGKSDIVWRNAANGQNYLWLMNGLNISNQGYLPTIADTTWQIVGVADLNGDGNSDILWRNTSSGQIYLWLMNGLNISNQGYLPTIADTNWQMVGFNDLDGDGSADIVWRNSATGDNYVWLMNGLSITTQGYLPTIADTTWEMVGFGDADGDGKSDITWRNKSNGQNYLWLMNGLNIANQGYLPTIADMNWQMAGFGDIDGDGKADITWRNVTNGQHYLWLQNGLNTLNQGYLPTISDINWKPIPAR